MYIVFYIMTSIFSLFAGLFASEGDWLHATFGIIMAVFNFIVAERALKRARG